MKTTLCSCICSLLVGALASPAAAQYGIFDSIADWEGRGSIKVEGNVEVEGEGDSAAYHLWGNGDDIWDNQDEGLFLYTELEGNWSLEARLQWVAPGTNDWAKIGVMIRENPQDPASRHYWIEMRGAGMGDRVDAQWRTSTGGSSGNAQIFFPPQTPLAGDPVDAIGGVTWLRVTRIADLNLFYSEVSDDGMEWIMVHNQIQDWPSNTAGFGLAITDHTDTNQLAHGIATNVRITEPARVKPIDSPIFKYHMDVYNDFERLGAIGGAEYDAASDTYTVWGSGWDIWDDSDNGHFLFTQVSGDFELIATAEFDPERSDPPHDDWFKIMLWARQDLTGGAVNYGSRVRGGNTPDLNEGQFSWQKRQTANGGSASQGADRVILGPPGLNLGEWRMRILREGDQFSLYYLEDFGPQAGEWIEVQSAWRADQIVPMNDPIFVGLAVTSHQNGGPGGDIVYSVFSNVELNVVDEVAVSDWSLY